MIWGSIKQKFGRAYWRGFQHGAGGEVWASKRGPGLGGKRGVKGIERELRYPIATQRTTHPQAASLIFAIFIVQ